MEVVSLETEPLLYLIAMPEYDWEMLSMYKLLCSLGRIPDYRIETSQSNHYTDL